MSFCINHWCFGRENPEDVTTCQYCGTELDVKGRYRLIRSLINKPRPYSEVFEVEDLIDNRTRKVLKILFDTSNNAVTRLFEQEKQILHTLNHYGIPKFEDYFEFPISTPKTKFRCLVMEKIDGENLEEWLKRNGRISDESQALAWLKKLTTILLYLHERKLFHRDIKPSNIIHKPNDVIHKPYGNLVLIDFGTAREYTETVINGQIVTYVYSHGYTAPEQRNSQAVPQSDFYALGRTFVHLLTGRYPDNLDLDHWHTETEFPTSPLIHLINRLLEPEPKNRPQTAKEIINEIRTIEGQPVGATPSENRPQTSQEILNENPTNQQQPVVVTSSVGSQETPNVSIPENRENRRRSNLFALKLGVATLFTLGIVAAGFIIIRSIWCSTFSQCPPRSTTATQDSQEQKTVEETAIAQRENVQANIQDPKKLISSGEKPIAQRTKDLAEPYAKLMLNGMGFYFAGEYTKAFNAFDALRRKAQQETNVNPKDTDAYNEAKEALTNPEIEIARNNAAAWQRHELEGSPIYTIAVAAPVNQAEGTHILFGVAQAQYKAVDKQNINLVVVIADDRNMPAQAKANAEELVKRKDILAVIGHYTSPNTRAALPIYDQNKLAIISPTSTVVNLRTNSDGTTNKVFFRTTFTTRVEAQTLVNYLVNSTKDRKTKPGVAIFYNADEDYSKDKFAQFKEALKDKGTIIKEFDLSDPNQNFIASDSLEEVKDADVIVVISDGQTKTSAPFRRAIEVIKANKGEKRVLGANPLYVEDVLSKVSSTVGNKALVKKLFIAADWHPLQCGAMEYAKEANDRWLGDINRRAALSDDAVQVLLKTFKLKPDVSRSEVLQALSSGVQANSNAIKGKTISFNRDGDRKDSKAFIVTVELDGNKPKFVPLASDRCPESKQVQQS